MRPARSARSNSLSLSFTAPSPLFVAEATTHFDCGAGASSIGFALLIN